ncbi:MAG: hypothetical protein EHM36_13780, partial [Deltaproteobacteria bacterium]
MPPCLGKLNWIPERPIRITETLQQRRCPMGLGKTNVLLTAGVVLVLASCSGLTRPSPKIEHYSLEYALPVQEKLAPLPFVLKLDRFSAAPLYDTRQIVYREKPFARDAYVYHRWRSTPADLVTYFLSRDLKFSGLFAGVLPHDSGQQGMFELEGTVDEFLEADLDNAWEAVVTF